VQLDSKIGKTENGIVSVNAYGLLNGLTYPLLLKIFKPRHRLKAGDKYKTKPQLAVETLQELKAYGFIIELVLADSLYGESWYIMTNLTGKVHRELAQLYSLRNWIEYGFKQVKNELGWADFRLTDYDSIERWWEMIFSTYLLVTLQADYFQSCLEQPESSKGTSGIVLECFWQHRWWAAGTTWRSALNNLRLIIGPYIFYCLLAPWLEVFSIPGLKRGFFRLMMHMNCFRGSPQLSQTIAA